MKRAEYLAKFEAMYELYKWGYNLNEIGRIFGNTHQSISDAFKRHGFELRPQLKKPKYFYKGEAYTLDRDGYLKKTSGDHKWLHMVIWEEYYGLIPENHEVHHRDENKLNNDISNLECLHYTAHGRIHKPIYQTPDNHCLYCGKKIERRHYPKAHYDTPAAVRRRKYCSHECHSLAQIIHPVRMTAKERIN